MALDTFDFPFHNPEHDYQPNSIGLQFGGGWFFSSGPQGPMVRVFTLSFSGMEVYTNTTTKLADATISPQRNAYALDKFYQDHGTYAKFSYPHPYLGTLTVQFKTPFKMPKIKGQGVVEDFTVTLAEVLQ